MDTPSRYCLTILSSRINS
ncbi:protein YsgD [Escherichia coli]|nr:protein YsgD [Escherichia coli]MCQ7032639.1 protein YsgD [Escherichia coli]